jgi:hypothetical protein
MATRKQVARVPSSDPPDYCCNECWFFETRELEFGVCYGHAPQVVIDDEGDPVFVRPVVRPEDRGCVIWKPRHKA